MENLQANDQDLITDDLTQCTSLVERMQWLKTHRKNDIAIQFMADGETLDCALSYSDLDRCARCFAATLQRLDLSGERVVLMLPTGKDYVVALFGCLYAGCIAIPSFPPRPNRSLKRVESILTDATPAAIIVQEEVLGNKNLCELLNHHKQSTQLLTTTAMTNDNAERWLDPCVRQEAIAMLQYTSGSTSSPKGVMVSHGNLLNNCQMLIQALKPSRKTQGLSWLPLFHDMGLIGGVIMPLSVGFPMIIMNFESFLIRPLRWLNAISKHRVNWSVAPSFAYSHCVRKISEEQRKHLDLSCWEMAMVGAEPVRYTTLNDFCREFQYCGFNPSTFYPAYGLAEASLFVTGGAQDIAPTLYQKNERRGQEDAVLNASVCSDASNTLVSCGWSWGSECVLIVNSNTATICNEGDTGEIWITGPNVAKGYWKKSEITQSVFHARVTGDSRQFLRTGDFGFQIGRDIYITGRLKNMMVVAGRNVHLEDVEHTVCNSHTDLYAGACAAFSIEEGEDELLVLMVELDRQCLAGTSNNTNSMAASSFFNDIRAGITRSVVIQHELNVHKLFLVKAGEISRTSSGKIQHHECRNRYLAGGLADSALG